MNNASRLTSILVLAWAPYDAFARGGRGSETGFKFMLGVGALVLIGWLLSQVKADTWRVLGGLLVWITAATFLIQLIAWIAS